MCELADYFSIQTELKFSQALTKHYLSSLYHQVHFSTKLDERCCKNMYSERAWSS